MVENRICLNPWNYLSVEQDGNCYFCCSVFSPDKFSIGNIFEQNIEEIWNGEKAKSFRKDVLDSLYSHCDIKYCRFCYERYDEFFSPASDNLIAPNPLVVHFGYDYTCSQKCIFCRDNVRGFTKQQEEEYNKLIDTKFIPLLSNAQILSISGLGEIFDSNHSKLLVKKAVESNKKLQLELWSNGIKFDKENIEALNIQDRIRTVHISVNAATKKVHKEIFRSNSFDKVKENILYLNELKKNNKIKDIHLNFIINEKNYRDMKKFMEFVNTTEAVVSFTPAHSSDTTFTRKDEIFAVHKPTHYLYNDFIRRLNDPIFQSRNCNLDFDTNLEPISKIQTMKNYLNRFRTTGTEEKK